MSPYLKMYLGVSPCHYTLYCRHNDLSFGELILILKVEMDRVQLSEFVPNILSIQHTILSY